MSPSANHSLQLLKQQRQFHLHNIPHHIKIDSQVSVDQLIAHRNDLSPGDFCMGKPDVIRDASSRFTDELEIAQNSILHEVVGLELRTIQTCAVTHGTVGEALHILRIETPVASGAAFRG